MARPVTSCESRSRVSGSKLESTNDPFGRSSTKISEAHYFEKSHDVAASKPIERPFPSVNKFPIFKKLGANVQIHGPDKGHSLEQQSKISLSKNAAKKYIADAFAYYWPSSDLSSNSTVDERKGILKNKHDPIYLYDFCGETGENTETDSPTSGYKIEIDCTPAETSCKFASNDKPSQESDIKNHEATKYIDPNDKFFESDEVVEKRAVSSQDINRSESFNISSVTYNSISQNRPKLHATDPKSYTSVSQISKAAGLYPPFHDIESSGSSNHDVLEQLDSALDSSTNALIESSVDSTISLDQDILSNSPSKSTTQLESQTSKITFAFDKGSVVESFSDRPEIRDLSPSKTSLCDSISTSLSLQTLTIDGNDISDTIHDFQQSKATWPTIEQLEKYARLDLDNRIEEYKVADPQSRRFIRSCQQVSASLAKVIFSGVEFQKQHLDFLAMLDFSSKPAKPVVEFDLTPTYCDKIGKILPKEVMLDSEKARNGILKKNPRLFDFHEKNIELDSSGPSLIVQFMVDNLNTESRDCKESEGPTIKISQILNYFVNQLILPCKSRALEFLAQQRDFAVTIAAASASLTAVSVRYENISRTDDFIKECLEMVMEHLWVSYKRFEDYKNSDVARILQDDLANIEHANHQISSCTIFLADAFYYQSFQRELASYRKLSENICGLLKTRGQQLQTCTRELFIALCQTKKAMGLI